MEGVKYFLYSTVGEGGGGRGREGEGGGGRGREGEEEGGGRGRGFGWAAVNTTHLCGAVLTCIYLRLECLLSQSLGNESSREGRGGEGRGGEGRGGKGRGGEGRGGKRGGGEGGEGREEGRGGKGREEGRGGDGREEGCKLHVQSQLFTARITHTHFLATPLVHINTNRRDTLLHLLLPLQLRLQLSMHAPPTNTKPHPPARLLPWGHCSVPLTLPTTAAVLHVSSALNSSCAGRRCGQLLAASA